MVFTVAAVRLFPKQTSGGEDRSAPVVRSAILMAAASRGILPVNGETTMAQPQLSVRSAKARELAHRLARREKRTIADVVERALESYEIREAGHEPAPSFYARLSANYGADIDLEAVIRQFRSAHAGPDL